MESVEFCQQLVRVILTYKFFEIMFVYSQSLYPLLRIVCNPCIQRYSKVNSLENSKKNVMLPIVLVLISYVQGIAHTIRIIYPLLFGSLYNVDLINNYQRSARYVSLNVY